MERVRQAGPGKTLCTAVISFSLKNRLRREDGELRSKREQTKFCGQNSRSPLPPCSVDFLSLPGSVTYLYVSPRRGVGFDDIVLILSPGFLPDVLLRERENKDTRLWLAERERVSMPPVARGSSLWVVAGVQCVSQGLLIPDLVIDGHPVLF